MQVDAIMEVGWVSMVDVVVSGQCSMACSRFGVRRE
jgi:hypothetical protein